MSIVHWLGGPLVALSLMSAPVQAFAEAPVAATTGVETAVTLDRLDNGLEIVVIPDRRAPIVTHMLWYKVGAADEEPGKSGIAHFFEHLMFKGTRNVPQGEFSRRIAEIGGRENAFTSNDYTAYFQQVEPSALADMMAMEADRMRNLILNDAVIKTERDVVIEERRSRIENEPSGLLAEEVDATLYQNHPYGIPVIGWMHEIEKLNLKDAVSFYDRFYAPNNAVLVVTGDVDRAEVLELAAATYGKVPRGPDLPPRLRPTEPEQNTARTVTLADPRVTLPSFQRSWVVPSYTSARRAGRKAEAAALDLLSEILGGGLRSRLHQELVVKRGIAASVGAYYQGNALDDTDMAVYGSPRGSATLSELEAAVDAEIARLVEGGVTDDELRRAKDRFVRSTIFARDSQSGMARMYGSTLTTGGSVEDIATWPDEIAAVTGAEIQAAAAKYLDKSRSVTGYLLPVGEVKK